MSTAVGSTMREDLALEARVAASVSRQRGQPPAAAWPLRRVRTRVAAYSSLHVFRRSDSSGGPPEEPGVVVKVFRGGEDALERARVQHQTLVDLWPMFSATAAFGVPRPLDFFPDVPALVMEEVQGRPLHALFGPMPWGFPFQRPPVDACRGAGGWLRTLHESTRMAPGAIDVGAKLAALPDVARRLRRLRCPASVVVDIERLIRESATGLDDRPLPRALVHGDFSVDNVLVAPGRIVGVDIDGRYRNAVYHDLASFLNSVDLMALSRPLPARVRKACGEAFLSGYLQGDSCDDDALRFLRGFGLACTAVEIIHRRAGQPLVGRLVRGAVTRALRRFVATGGRR